jgi:hypothetical protein
MNHPMRTVKVEAQRDEEGRYYAINPFTKRKVYHEAKKGQTVNFTPIDFVNPPMPSSLSEEEIKELRAFSSVNIAEQFTPRSRSF